MASASYFKTGVFLSCKDRAFFYYHVITSQNIILGNLTCFVRNDTRGDCDALIVWAAGKIQGLPFHTVGLTVVCVINAQ